MINFCWPCGTIVYRGGRLRMIGHGDDFPGDCAEQQTRGCHVVRRLKRVVALQPLGVNVSVEYPVDAALFHELRWEMP